MQLKIKVTARARKDEVVEAVPLEVYVQAPPEDNRANMAVIKLLTKYFGKPVKIVHGLKGRNKIIEI